MGMRPPKQPPSAPPSDPDIDHFDDDDPLDSDLSLYFDSEDAQVRLFRYTTAPGTGGGPAYVSSMSPKEFDLNAIREQYGGGRFLVRVRVGRSIVKRFNFTIEGPPIQQRPDDAGGTRIPVDSTTDRTLAMLEKQIMDLRQQLQQAAGGGRPDLSLMKELVGMMRDMNLGPPQSNVSGEVVGQAILKGIELAEMREGGIPWGTIIEKVGPFLEGITKAINQPRPAGRPLPPPAPAPAPGPAASRAGMNPHDLSIPPIVIDSFKAYGSVLVDASRKGKDPALYADLLLDNIPEGLLPELDTWLAKEGCLTDLAKAFPVIAESEPVMRWWERFRQEIKAAMRPESEKDEDPDA